MSSFTIITIIIIIIIIIMFLWTFAVWNKIRLIDWLIRGGAPRLFAIQIHVYFTLLYKES